MISLKTKEEAKLYFAKHFDKELQNDLDQIIRMPGTANIKEEVALYKISIQNIVKLYAAALKTEDISTIDSAAQFLQDKLRAYAEMVKIQVQLESMSRDKITYDQLKLIMSRVLDIVSIECNRRGYHNLADSIEETISEELNMQLNPRGTTLRPDRDVTEMIASIPEN